MKTTVHPAALAFGDVGKEVKKNNDAKRYQQLECMYSKCTSSERRIATFLMRIEKKR